MSDKEIEAISQVNAALSKLDDDPSARARVLKWANEKFGFSLSPAPRSSAPLATSGPIRAEAGEIPGIANVDEEGKLHFTIRDPKAKNAKDAVIRLSHVALLAAKSLTGKGLSRTKDIVPLLQHWRVYDGNARKTLRDQKGFLKRGDLLELDGQAQKDAEGYMSEMQDPEFQTSWKPGAAPKRRSNAIKPE